MLNTIGSFLRDYAEGLCAIGALILSIWSLIKSNNSETIINETKAQTDELAAQNLNLEEQVTVLRDLVNVFSQENEFRKKEAERIHKIDKEIHKPKFAFNYKENEGGRVVIHYINNGGDALGLYFDLIDAMHCTIKLSPEKSVFNQGDQITFQISFYTANRINDDGFEGKILFYDKNRNRYSQSIRYKNKQPSIDQPVELIV